MGEMQILDRTGDTKIIWEADNADEVGAAREMFDKLKKKGFSFFSVKKDGSKGSRVDEFNPDQEALIAVPRVVGG